MRSKAYFAEIEHEIRAFRVHASVGKAQRRWLWSWVDEIESWDEPKRLDLAYEDVETSVTIMVVVKPEPET